MRPYVAPTRARSCRPGLLELVADARERPAHGERLREHVEQRGALLERVHQAAVGADLLRAQVVEQAGGAADVELALVLDLVERAADRGEERALLRRQARLVEGAREQARAEPRADQALAQVVAGPAHEPDVDRRRERVALLRDAAGRRDHDHDHDVRLQLEHVDVADGRGLERRRRDEREQPRHLRQHLGRRLERLLDLGARGGQVERELGRPRLLPREQPVDVDAVAGLGRDAPRRGVRMREQAAPLELRQLRAHGRRRDRARRPARRASSSRPAARSRRTPRRRGRGSRAAGPEAARSSGHGRRERRPLGLASPRLAGDPRGARPAPSRAQASSAAVTASPRKRPRAVSASPSPRRSARPSRSSRPSSPRVERVLEARERDRLVEAQAQHHALRLARLPARAPRARAAGGGPPRAPPGSRGSTVRSASADSRLC